MPISPRVQDHPVVVGWVVHKQVWHQVAAEILSGTDKLCWQPPHPHQLAHPVPLPLELPMGHKSPGNGESAKGDQRQIMAREKGWQKHKRKISPTVVVPRNEEQGFAQAGGHKAWLSQAQLWTRSCMVPTRLRALGGGKPRVLVSPSGKDLTGGCWISLESRRGWVLS